MTIKRLVGLELETEGTGPEELPSARYWDYHTEGSLRGSHTEFVLRKPLVDPRLSTALGELSTLVQGRINLSERTSLHVHIDVTDLSSDQVYSICLAYTLLERPLYSLSGSRNYSKYCVPVYMSGFLQRAIASFSTGINNVTTDYRYGGLNLNSISKFNSLEFRMHEGSLDMKEIYSWAKILHDLVENTKDIKPSTILERGSSLTGLISLANEVFESGDLVSSIIENSDGGLGHSIKTAEQIHLMAMREGYVNN